MKFLLVLVLGVAPVLAAEERLVLTPKFLNVLVEEARTNHPGLRAAEARLRSARQGERAVKFWEDPEVSLGGMIGRGVPREMEGDLVVGLDQMLPITGKPQAERALMRAEVGVTEADRNVRFQLLRKEIAQTAVRAALAEAILRISKEDQGWVGTMVADTQARYQSGRASQVEVLRMETEHVARAEQLRAAARERDAELLMLNRLLNRPLTNGWPEFGLPELVKPLAANEQLLGLAVRGEPKLKWMRQEKLRADSASEVARRARRPDFTLGLEGRQFSGSGELKEGAIFLRMSVPWFNKGKYDAAYLREKEKAAAAELDAVEYEAQVRDEISRLAIRIENARRQAVLYRDQVIPRSEQALRAAEHAWGSGRGMFHDLLEARRLLLEGRTMQARALADQYVALAELVLCCGLADLEAVELFEQGLGGTPVLPIIKEGN